jgi:hypothetical protein
VFCITSTQVFSGAQERSLKAAQRQEPPMQLSPALQALPHAPQCAEFESVSMHALSAGQ